MPFTHSGVGRPRSTASTVASLSGNDVHVQPCTTRIRTHVNRRVYTLRTPAHPQTEASRKSFWRLRRKERNGQAPGAVNRRTHRGEPRRYSRADVSLPKRKIFACKMARIELPQRSFNLRYKNFGSQYFFFLTEKLSIVIKNPPDSILQDVCSQYYGQSARVPLNFGLVFCMMSVHINGVQ